MKSSIFCLFSAALGVSGAQAALTASDSFLTGGTDYSVGGLNTQNPAVSGFTGAWSGNGAFNVSATGLTYGGLVSSGGSVQATGTDGRTSHVLSTTYTNSTVGVVYISFLMDLGSVSSQFRALELHNGAASDANRTFQLGNGGSTGISTGGSTANATNYGLRVNLSESLRIDLGTANTDVNLFVLRFDLSATALGDSLTVYRNPTLGVEPTVPIGSLSGFDIQFDRIALAEFGSSTAAWDEVRIGDSYASVTPVPEPTLSVLGLVSGVSLLARRRR